MVDETTDFVTLEQHITFVYYINAKNARLQHFSICDTLVIVEQLLLTCSVFETVLLPGTILMSASMLLLHVMELLQQQASKFVLPKVD